MSNFFRPMFKSRTWNTGDGGAFGSFYNLINGTGSGMFRITLIAASLALLIGLGIAVLQFIVASSGRPKDEAKAKIMRMLVIAFGVCGGFVFLVDLIYTIFSW